MKELAWKLFEQTGKIAYYQLYKELSGDGRDDKSRSVKGDGLQGK